MKSVDPPDRLAGTQYRTVARIGAGGFGEVVLAEHRVIKRKVCVKLLHPDMTDDASLVDRFRIEAQALGSLGGGKHPHLVHVHDFDVTPRNQPFLVMEYLEGRTVHAERRARGEIPWTEAVVWMRQILDAVGEAHRAGIVHRDLKPANLFLVQHEDGSKTIKVLDFGIAKIVHGDGLVAPAAIPTAAGSLLGTPRYASPEQIRSEAVDGRTDLYSLGLVLFELVTGTPPFQSMNTFEEVCLAQALEPLPLASSLAKQMLPHGLDDLIVRATQKDREGRFPDAASFARELAALVQPGSLEATSPALAAQQQDELDDPTVRTPDAPSVIAASELEARPEPAKIPAPLPAYRKTQPLEQARPAQGSARRQTKAQPASTEPLPTAPMSTLPVERVVAVAPGGRGRKGSPAPPRRRVKRGFAFMVVAIVSSLVFAAIGWWLLWGSGLLR